MTRGDLSPERMRKSFERIDAGDYLPLSDLWCELDAQDATEEQMSESFENLIKTLAAHGVTTEHGIRDVLFACYGPILEERTADFVQHRIEWMQRTGFLKNGLVVDPN